MEIQQILAILKMAYIWTLYGLGGLFMLALVLDPIVRWRDVFSPLVPESHRLPAVIETSFDVIKD